MLGNDLASHHSKAIDLSYDDVKRVFECYMKFDWLG